MSHTLDGDLGLIASPIDFLGVNYYSRTVVRSPSLPTPDVRPSGPERTAMGWEVIRTG